MMYSKLEKNMIKILFRVIQWLRAEKTITSIPNLS